MLGLLMPGWVTVFGRVKHLGTEPGTQVDSGSAIPPWVGKSDVAPATARLEMASPA